MNPFSKILDVFILQTIFGSKLNLVNPRNAFSCCNGRRSNWDTNGVAKAIPIWHYRVHYNVVTIYREEFSLAMARCNSFVAMTDEIVLNKNKPKNRPLFGTKYYKPKISLLLGIKLFSQNQFRGEKRGSIIGCYKS